jgi:hypothetical protein
MEYSDQKNGKYITGSMKTGRYEWTDNKEFRYTFEKTRADQISAQFPGSIVSPE